MISISRVFYMVKWNEFEDFEDGMSGMKIENDVVHSLSYNIPS